MNMFLHYTTLKKERKKISQVNQKLMLPYSIMHNNAMSLKNINKTL